MRIILAIAVARMGMLEKCLGHAVENMTGQVDLLLFGNGVPAADLRASVPPGVFGKVLVEDHPTNEGVPFALHRLWEMARVDAPGTGEDQIIAYIHDDTFIYGKGWDATIAHCFTVEPRCLLAGMSGGEGLGLDGLYSLPYQITNLIRLGFISNLPNAEHHGRRAVHPQRITVTDGCSMFIRRSLLDRIGGWNWWPFPHHNYDVAIACRVARAGGHAWYLPIAHDHLSGFTANSPAGQKLLTAKGGEGAIHGASARALYDQFRDVLPLRVR